MINDTEIKRTYEETVFLSVYEATKQLGISRTTLYFLVRKGEIPCAYIGDRKMFRLVDLRAFAASRVEFQGGSQKGEKVR